ncbi:MAG: FAD-containing oxidoreductase, partial [bacterium]|nr:FAD-containing oxidoreductase [bacterium]
SPNDSVTRFAGLGVDVFLGAARFVAPDAVEVDGQRLRFKKAIIATGARAVEPPIEGLAEAGYLTNETVFSLTEQPGEFVVIGGGPIGCELAQAFHRLGSAVTLIEASPQFLGREDSDAAEILLQQLKDEGVRVLLEAKVDSVSVEDGMKQIHINHAGQKYALSADQILVGVGRAPNVEGLNLEAAGVEYERKGVKVNDALQTTNSKIYAAGDICLPYKFTHTADFAARIAVQNALFPFLPKKKFSSLVIPWATYTDPEIAHVGAYARQLDEQGIEYETIKIGLDDVDRALLDGEQEGFLKVHVNAKNGQILGATMVARHAGEMISEVTLAMTQKIKLGSIGNVIHPYPTQAEIIRKSADQYNRKRLTPGRKKILQWILRIMR